MKYVIRLHNDKYELNKFTERLGGHDFGAFNFVWYYLSDGVTCFSISWPRPDRCGRVRVCKTRAIFLVIYSDTRGNKTFTYPYTRLRIVRNQTNNDGDPRRACVTAGGETWPCIERGVYRARSTGDIGLVWSVKRQRRNRVPSR